MNRIAEEARKRLVDRRRGIHRLYQGNRAEGQSLGEVEASSRERAEGRVAIELLDRLSAAEHRELEAIDAALDRIARGSFGYCCACEGAIGSQRLLAIPETPYCVACAADVARLAG